MKIINVIRPKDLYMVVDYEMDDDFNKTECICQKVLFAGLTEEGTIIPLGLENGKFKNLESMPVNFLGIYTLEELKKKGIPLVIKGEFEYE